ncbi:MAG TPA: hypothetical protein DEA22_14675 [Blastocatellia bacterium]|nr:hypothetical protein [Blastocatellia bacterium]
MRPRLEILALRYYVEDMAKPPIQKEPSKIYKWVRRLGFWGFMFFLIKGLLWLIVPALIAYLSVT